MRSSKQSNVKMEAKVKGANCEIYEGAVLFPNVILGNNVTVFPGAVIGRPPLSTGATAHKSEVTKLLPVYIGDNCVIGANAVIYMNVDIGNNTMICDTACIREGARIGSSCVIAMGVTINFNVQIGNRVKVMDNTHLTGNMVIEDDVFISHLVASANSNSMGRRETSMGGDLYEKGPVVRRFATIGGAAYLLPNVEIGENAIVAAGAVVTKNVAPRSLVMGTPARFYRHLTQEELLTE